MVRPVRPVTGSPGRSDGTIEAYGGPLLSCLLPDARNPYDLSGFLTGVPGDSARSKRIRRARPRGNPRMDLNLLVSWATAHRSNALLNTVFSSLLPPWFP